MVTSCTQHRVSLLGEVLEGELHPSAAELMVKTVWSALPWAYPGVEIDAFVVMPEDRDQQGVSGQERAIGGKGQPQEPTPTEVSAMERQPPAAALFQRGRAPIRATRQMLPGVFPRLMWCIDSRCVRRRASAAGYAAPAGPRTGVVCGNGAITCTSFAMDMTSTDVSGLSTRTRFAGRAAGTILQTRSESDLASTQSQQVIVPG